MWEQLLDWDEQLLIYLNSFGSPTYDEFWIFVTQIKNWIPLYALFFFLFLKTFPIKKALKGIFFTLLALGVSLGLTELIKVWIARIRPNNVLELGDTLRILQTPDDYSFFSGHAAVSIAITLFVVLALRHRYKWISLLFIWPLIFCWSRIYVGVHYPGDIITGILVGSILGYSIYAMYKRLN